MRRIPDHQRFDRLDTATVHQSEQHVRVRLGEAFVGAARGDEAVLQALLDKRARETGARLAGRDGQQETSCVQLVQHLARAGE